MNITAQNLKGTIPALVTPFTLDGSAIDYESLTSLIEWHIRAGVSGVVVSGSTGEAATLSEQEYADLVNAAVKICNGKIPCIVGIGSNSTDKAAKQASLLEQLGADAILLVAPPYNKPPQDGIFAHFAKVKAASSLPIIAYNVPGRTSVNILPKTIARLAADGIIIGLKEASGSQDQLMDIYALVGDKISLLSGEDSLVHATMTCGGRGTISASANVAPEMFVEITEAALSGNFSASLKAQVRALPIVRAMFAETNPIPVKTALALRGAIKHPTVRLPLVPASAQTVELIKGALQL